MITDEMLAKVDKALVAASEARMAMQGGYPDQWMVANVDGTDCVIIASVDHDDAPNLTVQPVADFIKECEETWLAGEEE